MSKKVPKTNAARELDQLGTPYELRQYESDPEHLEAELVAEKIGLPPEQVFKTLVAIGDIKGVCLAVIPADSQLDLKALAAATGNRKLHLAPLKDVQRLTGYIRGGVTALGCKKPYPVILDSSALEWNLISVSAGLRGLQILLAPSDYIRSVSATAASISRKKQQ
ncbi:MAG TPA: Cys-tRNA(Pro) deacylase [Terriglobales bacterium]|nr:Cys-tRNA(Pro) deacylase [Terriglobales bacterium]